MTPETPDGIDAQMLDDFFGEADEHLMSIRNSLLRLEASVDRAEPDAKVVEELFHDFHSFKGICAIVGLGAAEAVAHATEDFLRLMRDKKAHLTSRGLEVLVAATQKLEQFVAAFRSGKPVSGYESLLSDLKAQCDQWSVPPASSDKLARTFPIDAALSTRIDEAKAQGMLLWIFTFSPSHALDAQGINVNSVREQLTRTGEILNASSNISKEGALTFEFLVAAPAAPTDLAGWEAKGVLVQPAELEEPGIESSLSDRTASSEEPEHNPFFAPSHVVRVDLKHLDDLMRLAGEMVIQRSRLDAQLLRLNGQPGRIDVRGIQELSTGLARSLKELRGSIMRVRLVAVAEIFARMPFVVRDLGRQTQKKVRLKLSGQETAIDKYVIERLKDPLLHLVRNAFSHGVESQAERIAAGKPEEAVIELNATTAGDSVVIQVRDDGRGINQSAILQRARKLGFEIPEVIDPELILKILCSSGFSTREDADRASGRGVGMAVVYSTVRELGGHLSLESQEGEGTQFTIRLPLTLAIADTFIVTVSGQTCAVPQSFVREILQISETEIQKANGAEIIPYKDGVLPVIRLANFFQLPGTPGSKFYLLVITSDRGSVGLLADGIKGQREVVVRTLQDPLIQVTGVSGATELGDGKPVLILDGAAFTRGIVRPPERLQTNTANDDANPAEVLR